MQQQGGWGVADRQDGNDPLAPIGAGIGLALGAGAIALPIAASRSEGLASACE
jgi:hypothetical protein